MGKAVFYSENSVMSPFVGAVAFQRESMMEKGRLKTADGMSETRSVRFQATQLQRYCAVFSSKNSITACTFFVRWLCCR